MAPHRIRAESAAAGRTLGEIPLPAGTVVAAVIRDGQPVVPGPDHQLQPGDILLLVTQTATEHDIAPAFQ